MAHEHEPPTRRIEPEPGATGVRRTEEVADDHVAAHHELLDRIASLRTALALVGVLAVAALGVALWALLGEDDDETAPRGASPARVSALDDRVDELEEQIDDRATKDSVSDLRKDQQQLSEDVAKLQEDGDGGQETDDLRADVQQLEQRIEDLESQQQSGASTEP